MAKESEAIFRKKDEDELQIGPEGGMGVPGDASILPPTGKDAEFKGGIVRRKDEEEKEDQRSES